MNSSSDKPRFGFSRALLLVLGLLLTFRFVGGCQLSAPSLSVVEGDFLEMESLRTLEGEPVSISDWRGSVVVLNFWATWCPPCVKELPNLINLREKTRDRNILVYCVSDEALSKQTDFIERGGHPREMFLASLEDTSPIIGSAIPVTLILDGSGKVRSAHTGAAAWDADPVVELLTELASASPASQNSPNPAQAD